MNSKNNKLFDLLYLNKCNQEINNTNVKLSDNENLETFICNSDSLNIKNLNSRVVEANLRKNIYRVENKIFMKIFS